MNSINLYKYMRLVLITGFCIGTVSAASLEELRLLEPIDTSSPRTTVYGFIDTLNQAYTITTTEGRTLSNRAQRRALAEKALRCLDMGEISGFTRFNVGREVGVCLKEVMDRVPIPPAEDIPGGTANLPKRWRLPYTEIVLERMDTGPRSSEYLFSQQTMARAVEFYERTKHLPYRTEGPTVSPDFAEWYRSEPGSRLLAELVRALPSWTQKRFNGHTVWQWFGLLITVVVGLILMLVVYSVGRIRARRFRSLNAIRYLFTLAFPIIAMLIPLAINRIARDQLVIHGSLLKVLGFVTGIAFLLAVVVFTLNLGSRIAALAVSSKRLGTNDVNAYFIRLIFRTISVIAAVIVILQGGQHLGIPLATLLAGAGVGGLAVALAAQDMLKNLFGSMMIVIDKPYEVGERIITKGHDGVVEEIGLRSTKIRLLNGHLVSIPNEDMARGDIENVGRRRHIRRKTSLKLPLETPIAKLEKAVTLIRDILQRHGVTDPELAPRIHFDEFNADSFNIIIFMWFSPPDYWEYLVRSEKINIEICQAFEREDISFSLPNRILPVDMDNRGPAELKVTSLNS